MGKKDKATSLTIQFDNHRALHHFWSWLCNSGEQQYWEAQRYREDEEDGDITALDFNYDNADRGLVITKCGRFTGEFSE